MGEAVDESFSLLAPADIMALVVYLRSVPAVASSEPGTIAPPAPPSPKQGGETADILGRRVFEGACVSCHNWTGVSAISPYATIRHPSSKRSARNKCCPDRDIWNDEAHAVGRPLNAGFRRDLLRRGNCRGRQLRNATLWQRKAHNFRQGRG